MEVSLTPLIAHLGKMLFASILVERFLVGFGWLMNQLLMIKTGADWKVDEAFNESLKEAERAKKDEDALLSKEKAIDEDPLEIPAHPDRSDAIPESNFEVLELPQPGRMGTVQQWMDVVIKQHQVKKEFWMQILGLLVAITACIYTRFSSWVFVIWANKDGVHLEDIEPSLWGYIFTGVIIGAGTKPVNFLLNFLLERKIVKVQDDEETQHETAQTTSAEAPASTQEPSRSSIVSTGPSTDAVDIEEKIGFQYSGGDRPGRLDHTHLFRGDIDLIIYHHTAMHSSAGFPELVRVFDDRGWLTGYHCVVFADGSIRPLCRWDRFSNNAKGFNTRSMSVALMGNFETNPKVPFSNHDGRYGLQHPTAKQMDAAARITALWVMMHDKIPPDFVKKPEDIYTSDTLPSGILPHDYVARKACPGNNFPHELFRMKVKRYHDQWSGDAGFKQGLKEFKLRPMVCATNNS